MPKQPKILTPTKQSGQLSASGGELVNYLTRYVPDFITPKWLEAYNWRVFVANQPIAVVCRETLISNLLDLDWAVVPRDSTQQDERKDEIKYYARMLENASGYYSDFDFTSHIEWIAKDLLDLPFGGAAELGRENDDPNGKVVWIRPLDAGTLMPTLDREWPVVQRVPEYPATGVAFPRHAISRVFMSPRTDIRREGWGMAPPEKIYLTMELLYRGDRYYANLLLDTPEIGILDLGDMEQESAEQWIKSFRDLMVGIDPFKIPVLYEHTTQAKWMSFGKLPNDIMFDRITMKYASVVAASYGLSLSDIGFPSEGAGGGDTLAGTIRQERHTRRTGFARLKKKFVAYFNKIVPEDLEFRWIDYDAEDNVAKGRARLANAQAAEIWIRNQGFSSDEMRLQAIRDGLVTIPVPEKLKRSAVEWPQTSGTSTRPGLVGDPIAPSEGGQGDLLAQQVISRGEFPPEIQLAKAASRAFPIIAALVDKAKKDLKGKKFTAWSALVDKAAFGAEADKELTDVILSAKERIEKSLGLDTVSTHENAIESVTDEIERRVFSDCQQRADAEFIAGARKSRNLTEAEINAANTKIARIDAEEIIRGVQEKTRETFQSLVSSATIVLLKQKLDIDTRDGINHNKASTVESVAKELANILSTLYETALYTGQKNLNERIKYVTESTEEV